MSQRKRNIIEKANPDLSTRRSYDGIFPGTMGEDGGIGLVSEEIFRPED